MSSSAVGKAFPERIAAIAPMGACGGSLRPDYDMRYRLPTFMLVGGADDLNIRPDENGVPMAVGLMPGTVEQALNINGIPTGAPDYAANPYWGHPADEVRQEVLGDLTYHICDYRVNGETLVRAVIVDDIVHTYTDRMADLAWDFLSRFTR